MNRWPALTILGITAAITIALIHATLTRLTDTILGYDDIQP